MNELTSNNPIVRQEILREKLKRERQLIATELAKEFDISLDTIRRDLLALEEEGLVQRVRGGAMLRRTPESTYAERTAQPKADCSRIVAEAVTLVKEGMTIMIDGGTTNVRFAERLPAFPELKVITPSPNVACAMLEKNVETHLIGGRLSPWGGSAVGSEAEAALSNLSADLAFLGICALDETFGLSAHHADEASVMRVMAKSARDTVLLLASSKLGQRATHRVQAPEDISFIVTDAEAGAMKPYSELGVEIIHV